MANILITEQIDPVGLDLLEEAGHTFFRMESRQQTELCEKIKEADAVIVRILDLPEAVIQGAPRLKLISKHGVGIDNIDISAAKSCGVTVTVTPGANSLSVAEHTIALLLALSKRLPYVTSQYRTAGFSARNSLPGVEVTGKTLGIIGCGQIGSHVARIASTGFSMRVLAYDPYLTQAPPGVTLVSDRDRVFREADFLTLHCGLTQETFHCIGARELALMKPTALFLNCARGPLVVEKALIHALEEGQIAGAGLDVTEQEPCPPGNPLFSMSNVLLTPHFAPATREAATAVSRIAAENIIAFFQGKALQGQIV